MRTRKVDLAACEAALRLRCAVQRGELARQVEDIEARLSSIDRVVTTTRRVLSRPAVIAAGAILIMVLGRTRTLRMMGRGALLVGATRRLLGALRF